MHQYLVRLFYYKKIIIVLAIPIIALFCYGVYVVYFLSSGPWTYISVYVRTSNKGLSVSSDELDLSKREKQLPYKSQLLLQMVGDQESCNLTIQEDNGSIIFNENVPGSSTVFVKNALYSIDFCGQKKMLDLRPY